MDNPPKSLLVIAGLDPSGGAGLIADVRIAEQMGVRAAAIVTALTEQNSQGVKRANPVDAKLLRRQLDLLLADMKFDAVKIGMVSNEEIAGEIAEALSALQIPIVWDPVLMPSKGVSLFDGDIAATFQSLRPVVSVITPNIPEAEVLTGMKIESVEQMEACARHMGVCVVKGGHLVQDAKESPDVLFDGTDIFVVEGCRFPMMESVHGTGCAFSTSLSCYLAKGAGLQCTVGSAKDFVREKIQQAFRLGRGAPSIV